MKTITIRTDQQVERALEDLMADGKTRSQAVREAILSAAHARRLEQLTAEAREVAADPDDLAEAKAVQADLEPLRAW